MAARSTNPRNKGRIRDLTTRPGGYTGKNPWQARWRHPTKPTERREKSFATKRLAKRWLAEQDNSADRNEWIDPRHGKQTVAAIIVEFKESRIKAGPKTRINQDSILRKHIEPTFGDRQVVALGPGDLQKWVNTLAKTHAPITVHNIYAVMRLVMAFAVGRNYIRFTPCTSVELPTTGDAEKRALTDAQVRRLLDAMAADEDRVVVLVAAYCGPRSGEVWALRKSDFTWRKRDDGQLIYELLIDEALKEVTANEPVPSDHERLSPSLMLGPTKTRRSRKLTTPNSIAVALNGIIDPSAPPASFIFTNTQGNPVRHGNWYKRVFVPAARAAFPEWTREAEQRVIRERAAQGKPPLRPSQLAMISPINFHTRRHTCASLIITQGKKAQHSKDIIAFDVTKYLGHKDIKTTFNIYAHWLEDAQEGVAAALDAGYREAAAAVPEPVALEPDVVVSLR